VRECIAVAVGSRFGFFYVTGHGVSEELISRQFDASRAVFALPSATKRSPAPEQHFCKHKAPTVVPEGANPTAGLAFVPELDIGYLADQALDEDTGVRDTKEGFLLTNNGVFDGAFDVDESDPLDGAQLKWPPVDGYEATMREWTRELYRLNHELNAVLFAALGLSETDRLALARQPFVVVKQLRYPPSQTQTGASSVLGAGAHADWGSLTILATDDVPGLEIELGEDTWLAVPPRRGCLIVNAGDQIHAWTRGAFKSANHRVRPTRRDVARFSTAFFAYFDRHARVEPLVAIPWAPQELPAMDTTTGEPMTTAEYFTFKLCESVGKSPDECRGADVGRPELSSSSAMLSSAAAAASSSSSSEL